MTDDTDQNTVPRLTGAQLLELIRAGQRGECVPCFVCRQPVADQTFTLGTGIEEERVMVNAPCGHRMTYNAKVAAQQAAEADRITAAEGKAATEATDAACGGELESLRREVAAARQFAEEMRTYCSPYGVSADYADRLIERMDRAKNEGVASRGR